MIYLIQDVHYQTDALKQTKTAKVSGIRFQGIETNDVLSKHTLIVNDVASYESEPFYKRESMVITLNNNLNK